MEINETGVSQWLSLIKKFMDRFGWLADSFVLDFYTQSHWTRLPSSWSEFLMTATPEELADIIDPNTTTIRPSSSGGHIPPLSLLAFKSSVSLLSLNRKYSEEAFTTWLNGISKQSRDSELREFTNLFRRHVKLKKRHEVEQVGRIVSALSCNTNATNVYDIGSGLGHLSRYLTYALNLRVTCVDKEQRFGVGASKFDMELESFLSKKNPKTLPQPPSHTNELLQFNNHTKLFNETTDKFGFTGLHACGNLSPLILHNFVHSKSDFVVSLGCCYMKMDQMGFPLSDQAKALGLNFSYEAFEVACHAIEQYCSRLRTNQANKLITHSYRATLETILTRHGIKHAGLRGVPHTEKLTFQEYALRAMSNLPEITLTTSELTSEEVNTHLNDWFKVVLFYSLRLMMAMVVESAVLLDRSLYLNSRTSATQTFVIPCFESSISARNLGIISLRL